MTLRSKILFWFLLPFILAGTVTVWSVYYYVSKIVEENIYSQLEIAVDGLQERIHMFMQEKKTRIVDFSSDGLIITCAGKILHRIDVDSYTFQLNRHLLYNKKPLDERNIVEVFVVNLDGKVISSTEISRIDKYVSDEDYFSVTMKKGFCINDLHYSPEFKQNTFEVSRLLIVGEGMKTIGIIVNRYSSKSLMRITGSGILEELGGIRKLEGLGETGEVYIVNREKFMITGSRFVKNAALRQVVDTDGVRIAFENGVGMDGIYLDYRGVSILGVSIYIEEMDWVVLAEKDVSEAFAPIKRLRNTTIIISVMGIMAITLIAILISKRVTLPIQKLVEGTKRIASGELGFKIPTRSKDEIGYLATSFNDMTSQLGESKKQIEDYAHNLEQKVDDKTKEIKHMLDELTYRNKEMEQIMYVTSHDLRSPLLNIQGFSKELVKDIEKVCQKLNENSTSSAVKEELAETLEEDIPEAIKFILVSSSKMDTLLSGLLRLSRMGRVRLTLKRLDMNKLMEDVIGAFEYNIKEAGVTLHVDELPSCNGDEAQISQVFSNLIDNALKYLDPNRKGVIRISGTRQLVYSVEDNGIGIEERHQDKAFEIFHRLNPVDSMAGEGLGLSIVRRILDRHGGKIWVESKPGKGSKFLVSLPA